MNTSFDTNNLNDDTNITFENFCDKNKIIYSIKPYIYDTKQNVIDFLQRIIHSHCIIRMHGFFTAEKYLNKPLSNETINHLKNFSGHNIHINNLIEKIYSYINSRLPDTYLIVFITYRQIYFQLTDKFFEKYILLQNKAYTTHLLFSFCYDKYNDDMFSQNFIMFDYNFKEYELNEENLSKIIELYKNKYIITQQIQNMFYRSHDDGIYYVKSGSFGDTILEFTIKTNNLENVYIEFNNEIVGIDKLNSIVQMFNLYKR